MAKLTGKERKAIPTREFAEPGKRKYPIEDKSHARNALSRVSQNGTPEEKTEVRAAVSRKYPNMGKKPTAEHAKKLAGALRGGDGGGYRR